MERAQELSPAVRAIIATAGVIILLGGMQLAGQIVSPIIFAVFVAILCLPIVRRRQRKMLPTWPIPNAGVLERIK